MITQKIKVLIVDDEPRSRNILQSMITNYCSEVEIVGQANSVENAQYLISLHNPDLVLLDIEMPFQNGFLLLENVKDNSFEVVFISAYDHFAPESLKYHALDYLLKPIDLEELENVIKKVKSIRYGMLKSMSLKSATHFKSKNLCLENKLAVTTQNGKKLLSVDEILYCEADGPCTWTYMTNGNKHYSSKNIGLLEKKLSDFDTVHFFRSHHTFLVNLMKVKSFYLNKNMLALENGVAIKIAQRRKKKLRELLKTH